MPHKLAGLAHIHHWHTIEGSCVAWLSTAGRIERRPIQRQPASAVDLLAVDHAGGELGQVGVFVVKAVGVHRSCRLQVADRRLQVPRSEWTECSLRLEVVSVILRLGEGSHVERPRHVHVRAAQVSFAKPQDDTHTFQLNRALRVTKCHLQLATCNFLLLEPAARDQQKHFFIAGKPT